eukprot:s148_g1.t1
MAPHVVFVALGSRGDVQPLAVLATQLAKSPKRPRVSLVSHGELERLKQDPNILSSVAYRPLSQPCFVATDDATETPDILDLQGRRRAEWVEAISLCQDADLLVCNLFAMPPVFHLSERLKIPWLCCSPSLIPYSMPPGFEEQFAEDMPDLFEVLKARDVPGDESLFSWSTVKTWLWPVFTESHAILREEFLGLSPVPGDVISHGKDRCAPETLKGAKFLLGIPKSLLTSQCTLPPNSVVCGSWMPEAPVEATGCEALQRFLLACQEKVDSGILKGAPFYIGFGSMGVEGLVPDVQRVTKVLLDTAKWMARPVVLMSHSLCEVPNEPHIFCCATDVSHRWLLPRCSVALHHGGIGTILAAARAKVPQLVMPLAFDQPFWGQTLEDLGVALVQHLDAADLAVPSVAKKLRQLLMEEVQMQVNRLGAMLEAEDGIQSAMNEIHQLLDALPSAKSAETRPALRPVHPISTDSGEIWGRSAGEVHFICREIEVEKCYGDLDKLPEKSIVVDGGLNLGIFSLVLARRWSRGAGQLTVLAFEPALESYQLAVRNLRQHGVQVVEHGQELSDEVF